MMMITAAGAGGGGGVGDDGAGASGLFSDVAWAESVASSASSVAATRAALSSLSPSERKREMANANGACAALATAEAPHRFFWDLVQV